jgi:hypothetical protein
MTVRELMELNGFITDAEIEVREDGNWLIDCLHIGPSEGVKPPYPTRVPRNHKCRNMQLSNDYYYKDATYIDKSINTWDDGKDYWGIKIDRIPKRWLELQVYSWNVWQASTIGGRRRRIDGGKNINFCGERINIVVLPDGQPMPVPEPERKKTLDENIERQMTITEFLQSMEA